MKDKRVLVVIIVVLLLLGGGAFVLSSNKAKKAAEQQPTAQEEVIPTLTPSEIGLTMMTDSSGKRVKFVIANVSDIKRIEYEITYDADVPQSSSGDNGGGDGSKVTRGTGGEADIKSSDTKYESKYHDLGSCSSGTCVYYSGIDEIKLLLKVTKRDGKVYQVEDSLKL